MPLPFILAGLVTTALGVGAKKGYDGYQDKSEANAIFRRAESDYNEAKANFDEVNDSVSESLNRLGQLQLNIGQDFEAFRKISAALLDKINQKNSRKITIDIPKAELDKIERLELSATSYLGKIAGGGVAGAAGAYAVYGGVMALAAASTGTPIAALSGAAAYNATMAAIGGGSLAAGGFGMAGGAMVLGGVVAAPILAIAGWAFASHAKEALNDARKTRNEVAEAVHKMEIASIQLNKTEEYVDRIYDATSNIYKVFTPYLHDLIEIARRLEMGERAASFQDEIILKIENGYKLAAILTDIITTPLFKVKTDINGKALVNKDNIVEIETDENGMQVLNEGGINKSLDSSSEKMKEF